MAIKKGICKNFGECSLADDKIVQEVDSTNFVCEECGSSLYECDGKNIDRSNSNTDPNTTTGTGNGGKTVKILLGCVAGLAVLGGAVYAFLGGKTDPEQITLDKTVSELEIGQSETLKATVKPDEATCQLEWTSSNPDVVSVAGGLVTAVAPGTAEVAVQVVESEVLKAVCEYTVPQKEADGKDIPEEVEKDKVQEGTPVGSVNLGYATYQGDVKNGKPHGNGTMMFKSNHLVPGTKDTYAAEGEQVIGAFRDGEINMGTLYQKNGNRVVVKHK